MEAALIPLTLSVSDAHAAPLADFSGRKRDLLALKAVDTDKLVDDKDISRLSRLLSPEWLSRQTAKFDRIRSLWQEAQRLAIGSSYDLLSRRLEQSHLHIMGELGGDAGDAPGDFLSGCVFRRNRPGIPI